jgi:zinc protease
MTVQRPFAAAVGCCLLWAACSATPPPTAPTTARPTMTETPRAAANPQPAMTETPPPTAAETPPAARPEPVLLPVPDDPTVSFDFWIRVGSQDDPPGKEGLALLTASMLAEGATAADSYQQVLQKLYPLASSYEARVDKEMTTLQGRTHRDNLAAYLELITNALLAPRFADDDFERLKSSQLAALEKNLRYSQDEELGKAALISMVFAGTGYAHPDLGTAGGLAAITLDDVKAFYHRYYNRNNVVLGLGGGFSPDLVTRLEQSLGRLGPGAPRATPAPATPPLHGRRVLLVSKPGADASISFGLPLDVHRGERDYYALWLANSWLGEHRNASSHLYQVIREARGLNYGDYSYVEAFPEGGRRSFPPPNVARRGQMFEVWIRTLPNDQAVFALRAALHELDRLVRQGMSEEEFQLTRSFLSKYSLHYAESTSDRLGYALDDRFYGIAPPGHLARLAEALTTLTRDEVNAALRRHLGTENLAIAIVTGEADEIRRQLVSGAPTPITYATEKSPAVMAADPEIAAFPLAIKAEAVRVVPVQEMFEK